MTCIMFFFSGGTVCCIRRFANFSLTNAGEIQCSKKIEVGIWSDVTRINME